METKGDAVFRVFYGANGVALDVTFDTLYNCCKGTQINIPGSNGDQDALFSDPLHGVVKHISIQENSDVRAFEPHKDVQYTCELNGEMLKLADLLRGSCASAEDLAMQMVLAMYCNDNQQILKVGGKFSIPNCICATDKENVTVLEADYERAAQFAGKYRAAKGVVVRPCALAYEQVLLSGTHVVSLVTMMQQADPNYNRTVMIHSGTDAHLETKDAEKTTQLPTFLSNDIGLATCTLGTLEKNQDACFDVLVFDSLRCLDKLLHDAAPMLLQRVSTVIVARKTHHQEFLGYLHTQMAIFGFVLRNTFTYRNTRHIQIWQRKRQQH